MKCRSREWDEALTMAEQGDPAHDGWTTRSSTKVHGTRRRGGACCTDVTPSHHACVDGGRCSVNDLPERRRLTFASLREMLSREDLDGVVQCAVKIHDALLNRDRLEDNVVLVAYGEGFPDTLIDIMQERYGDDAAFDRMRKHMDEYAKDAYGLTEQHLICMVYSPFAGEGAGLETYLTREQPALVDQMEGIRALLGSEDRPEALAEVVSALERISGLDLRQLRVLYRSPLRAPSAAADGSDLLGAILDGDPHKDVIRTQNAPNGPVVLEMLSGR